MSGSHPNPARTSARGRPTSYSEQTVALLCGFIRRRGLSDSAAARRAGVHPSTLSRWKQEHDELEPALGMAREDFRDAQLATIQSAAAAEGVYGWRAAAWLLERIFPEDYSPRAAERQAFREAERLFTATEEQDSSFQTHHELLAELQTTHPEDFDESGLYAPAELNPTETPDLAEPILEEEPLPDAPSPVPAAGLPIPSPSVPAPPAPAATIHPSELALQNLRNSGFPPMPFPPLTGLPPTPASRHRPAPGTYSFHRQL